MDVGQCAPIGFQSLFGTAEFLPGGVLTRDARQSVHVHRERRRRPATGLVQKIRLLPDKNADTVRNATGKIEISIRRAFRVHKSQCNMNEAA